MYIDPSASALITQLLISAGFGLYILLKRGYRGAQRLLARDPSHGLSSVLVAVSFANVTLLRIWTELLGFTEPDTFEMKVPTPWTHYAGAMIGLLLIALIVWPIVRHVSAPTLSGTVSSAALLVLCAVPLNAVRDVFGTEYFPMLRFGLVRAYGPAAVAGLCGSLVILAALAIIWLARPICRSLCLLLLIASPFTAVTAGRALWRALHLPYAFAASDQAQAHRGRGRTSGSRVVWLLFDEMDQRITFEDRPRDLEMPEFDRLRATAIYADAVQEAGPNTNPAVPSLLTGRTVVLGRVLGQARFGVTFQGSNKEIDITETSHLFRRAGALGFSSGIAGWEMPYCRLFGQELDQCWWCEGVRYDNSIRANLAGATIDSLRSLLETKNFSLFGQSICLRQHIENIENLTQVATTLATNESVDLVFVHLHGAHPPHVYDRRKHDLSLANSPIRGYADSLALCDLTLGRIRGAMEQRGLWDRTTVLVASDHHSRSSGVFDGKIDHRSIFILKMAGQSRGQVFSRPLNAVVSGDLILEILRGDVKNPNDARGWLDSKSQGRSERM
jgi:hypothetical protein